MCDVLPAPEVEAPEMDETDDPVVFDRDAALARSEGDEDFLRMLAGMFLGHYPGWLADIDAGLSRSDLETVRRAAHKLKGAVGNFAAEETTAAAQRVEDLAGDGDLPTTNEACRALERAVGRLGKRLTAYAGPPADCEPVAVGAA
jgi:HPt (histidine-containing phosphotransfer) domain-containing protein